MAYAMARAPAGLRGIPRRGGVLPFWDELPHPRLRPGIGILKPEGLLNGFLDLARADRHGPLTIPQTETAVLSASSLHLPCPSWYCRSTPRWKPVWTRGLIVGGAGSRLDAAGRAFWTVTRAALMARLVAGFAALLHPRGGRVRSSRPARRPSDTPDDSGPHPVERVSSPTRGLGRSPRRWRS